jgi:hypothetical protein
MLQVLLNGFGGLNLTPEGVIHLKTALPSSWKSITLKGVGPENKTYTVKKQ